MSDDNVVPIPVNLPFPVNDKGEIWPEQSHSSGWAKTLHPDFGEEMIRRWNAFEGSSDAIQDLRTQCGDLSAKFEDAVHEIQRLRFALAEIADDEDTNVEAATFARNTLAIDKTPGVE